MRDLLKLFASARLGHGYHFLSIAVLLLPLLGPRFSFSSKIKPWLSLFRRIFERPLW